MLLWHLPRSALHKINFIFHLHSKEKNKKTKQNKKQQETRCMITCSDRNSNRLRRCARNRFVFVPWDLLLVTVIPLCSLCSSQRLFSATCIGHRIGSRFFHIGTRQNADRWTSSQPRSRCLRVGQPGQVQGPLAVLLHLQSHQHTYGSNSKARPRGAFTGKGKLSSFSSSFFFPLHTPVNYQSYKLKYPTLSVSRRTDVSYPPCQIRGDPSI